MDRLQLVRRLVSVRGSISTSTCRSGRPTLARTIAHETYPGHHLEHAWKEADLVRAAGRLESSVLLINTPECLISEGLAELGYRFVVPPADESDLLVELYRVAGLAFADDAGAARDAAARTIAIERHRQALARRSR